MRCLRSLLMPVALFCDGTHREAEVEMDQLPVAYARIEGEAARAAAIAVRRSRPITAVRAHIGERRTVAIACGRKENKVSVGADNLITINSVHRNLLLPSTIIDEFLNFVQSRHTPTATPVGRRCIILCGQVTV